MPPNYTIETLFADHESQPRNSLIADTFYMAGYIETWGRGYEKIRQAFEKEQLQIPVFEQVRGGMMATIKREKFLTIQQGNNVGSNVVSSVARQLTDRQKNVLKLISSNPFFSAKQMSQVLSVVPRTVQRELSYLQKQGYIIREGNTSAGRWIILS